MFLVLGAQKCATSWLYLCLADHPRLHLPDRKLEVEYLGGDLHRERGDDWYRALVAPPAGRDLEPGDVSVEYLWDPASPGEVARLFPDARLIVSLRDPVARAVSAYHWYQRKGILPGTLGLAEALEEGADWLRRTEGSREVGAEAGTPAELVARGRYDIQLARWLERFPAERLLVLDYADVEARPAEVLERVWRFLGVPPHTPATLDERPKRNTYAPFLGRLERLAPRNRVWAFLLDQAQRRWPGRPASPLDAVPEPLVRELQEAFAPGMARTAALLASLPAANRPTRPSFAHPVPGDG